MKDDAASQTQLHGFAEPFVIPNIRKLTVGDDMTIRVLAIALLASTLSTAALAQGVGGGSVGGSPGGAAGGAPSSVPSGTAGVSPSTASPAVGTLGAPGPTSGAGLPGGPGPGNTAVVPNLPTPPASVSTVGSGSNTAASATNSTSSGRGGSNGQPTDKGTTERQSAAAAEFHPEAVIDQALTKASADITTMPSSELLELVTMFDVCTIGQHPSERQGKCAAASRRYKAAFARDRAIDRAIAELERVVRFQKMFRATTGISTDFEDNINKRLRGSAALALASTQQSEQVSLKQRK